MIASTTEVVQASNALDTGIQRLSYKIFDTENNLVSSGILPMNQSEVLSRYDGYSPMRLTNGQTMKLYSENGSPFFVNPNARIHMMFSMDSNSYVFAKIEKQNLLVHYY